VLRNDCAEAETNPQFASNVLFFHGDGSDARRTEVDGTCRPTNEREGQCCSKKIAAETSSLDGVFEIRPRASAA